MDCQTLLMENKRLIDINSHSSEAALKILFINYHTLKGGARGYKLHLLINNLHQAEAYCAQLREDLSSWDQTKLLNDYENVQKALSRYLEVSHEKLGYKEHSGKVVDTTSLRECLLMIESLPVELTDPYQKAIKNMRQLYYTRSDHVFSEIFAQTKTLAKDLNKEQPRIKIQGPVVGLTDEGITLLKNTFTHLVRNSMDHGLESAEERKSQGKDAAGTLFLTLGTNSDGLSLSFRDDGGGLRLKKLKEIGVSRNLIPESTNDPQTISQLIFHSGFSTASSVTDISGRGVGMDAVRSYIEQSGGNMQINFLHQVNPLDERAAVEFVMQLPPEMYTAHG